MEKYGKLVAPGTLKFERLLPGPIDRVWEFLTDAEKRGLWFAAGKLEAQQGGEMKLIFNNSTLSNPPDPTPEKYDEFGDGFISHATVITYEQNKKLVISWEGIVTFELEEVGDKVKLTLTHEKLKDDKTYKAGVFAGWHTHLDILFDRLSGKDPKGFWKIHMPLEEKYERLLD